MTGLILFDCDGTLVDSQHHIVATMTSAFAACDLPPPAAAAIRSTVGLSLVEAAAELLPGT
ncbi:MAG: HAD hydrolase-like protein, partial [Ferrovibrionaceae bacterium]